MPAINGSIVTLTLNDRSFAVPADQDANRNLGGWTNTIQPNGNGTARLQKIRTPWSLGGLAISVDDTRGDHEFIQSLKEAQDWFPIAVEYTSGIVYQGSGMITGENSYSNQNGTMGLELGGPGELTQQ